MSVQQSDLIDPALATEVDLARAAAQEEAGDERVGEYVAFHVEDEAAVTHLFEADKPGYHGWRYAVTITSAGPSSDITVSEVVLLPGPSALVAPDWIPWQNRVQAGDLGVGDLLPTDPDDPRLVPAYLQSDDPAVEETATEAGLGRVRVLSRPARVEVADRWHQSEFGPRSDMARSAPAHCGTCGFYLPLAGSLRAAFGTCGNELSPADAHVVHAEYGCGAHSEAEVEQVSPVLVADLIYDDAQLDVEPLTVVDEIPPPAEAVTPTATPEAPATKTPEPATEPEPVAEPEAAEATATPESVAEPKPATEPEAATESETIVQPEAAEATSTPEAVAEPDVIAQPEAAAESVATGQPEATTELEPAAQSEPAAEPAGDIRPVESAPIEEPATPVEPSSSAPVEDAPVDVPQVAPAEPSTTDAGGFLLPTAWVEEPVSEPEPASAEPVITSAEDAAPAELEPVVRLESHVAEPAAEAQPAEAAPEATLAQEQAVASEVALASEHAVAESGATTAVEPGAFSARDEGWVPLGQVFRLVGDSPLRPRPGVPQGLEPRRMPSFSLQVPRALIRRTFGPGRRNPSAGD